MNHFVLLSTVSLLAIAPAAYAANECGPAVQTITCASANNYDATGITYTQPGTYTVNIADGTSINYTMPGVDRAVIALGSGDSVSLSVGAGTSLTSNEYNANGIFVSALNRISIISAATITTTATLTADASRTRGTGIDAYLGNTLVGTPTIDITNTGSITVSGVATQNPMYGNPAGYGIRAEAASLNARITINSPGDIVVKDGSGAGIFAVAGEGGHVIINANNVRLDNPDDSWGSGAAISAQAGAGIMASPPTLGSIVINTTGTIIAPPIAGMGISASTGDGSPVTVNVLSGSVSARTAIQATSLYSPVGAVTVYVAGSVTGQNGEGIHTESADTTITIAASGSVTSSETAISMYGMVSTFGAHGKVHVDAQGAILSTGNNSAGIWGFARDVASITARNVTATGNNSQGISLNGWEPTTVTVNVLNVTAAGENSTGIDLAFDSDQRTNEINIDSGGTVTGGWAADPAASRASAIIIALGATTLNNAGTLTAGSDMAILSSPLGSQTINNSGVILGSIDMWSIPNPPLPHDVTFNNLAGGVYDLRFFADTDGDGVRDAKGIGFADFGPGPGNNTFINNPGAMLRLVGVTGEQTVDTTGQYLPEGSVVHDITQAGIVQGHLLQVARFENGGAIDLRGSVAGNVLVITGGTVAGTNAGGNFVSNGGSLHVNAMLNAGGAASQSDVLVVDNATTGADGATKIYVTNLGGSGAQTGNTGIMVVNVLGASSADAFALGRNVVAGVYDYQLYRGDASGTGEDFYLRSTEVIIPPGPPGPPERRVRPEVSLYAVLPTMALGYGNLLLDTLHERSGNAQTLRENGTDGYAGGAWGRFVGTQQKRNGGGLDSDGPNYDAAMYAFQFGIDLFRHVNNDGGRDYAGLYGAVGQVSGDVNHFGFGRAGDIDMTNYTAGAYWTHYGSAGWYVDAVGQVTWYDAEAKPRRDVIGLSTNGTGYAASLEAGYPIHLRGGTVIEPQVQLVYQTISFDDAADQGARVSYDDVDSLAARVGVRVAHTWLTSGQRQITAWVRPSVWQEFQGETRTQISGLNGEGAERFASNLAGTTGEITGGLSAELGSNWMLYSSLGYRGTFKEDDFAITAKGGLRFVW